MVYLDTNILIYAFTKNIDDENQKDISTIFTTIGENVTIEFVDKVKDRVVLKARSKDDDDIIDCVMGWFRG